MRSGTVGAKVLGNSPKSQRLLGLLLSFSQVIVPSLAVMALYFCRRVQQLARRARAARSRNPSPVWALSTLSRAGSGLWLFPSSGSLYSPLLLTDGQRTQGRVSGKPVGPIQRPCMRSHWPHWAMNAPPPRPCLFIAFPLIVLTAIALFRLGAIVHPTRQGQCGIGAGYCLQRTVPSGLWGARAFGCCASGADPWRRLAIATAAEAAALPRPLHLWRCLRCLLAVPAPDRGYLRSGPQSELTIHPNRWCRPLAGLCFWQSGLCPLFALILGCSGNRNLRILRVVAARLPDWRNPDRTQCAVGADRGFSQSAITSHGLLQGALGTTVLPKTRIDKGGQKAIISGTGYIGIFVAALGPFRTRDYRSGTAIVEVLLSVRLTLACRICFRNFNSGVDLALIERRFEATGSMWGHDGVPLRSISVRSTTIETL